MRPILHPRLVNGPFDDPGLFVPFFFEKRAVIFDLGDIYPLSSKDILKISHIFISHTHIDHFIGFDKILRLVLGREKELYIYGPKGICKNVEGKMAGYSWNLVDNFNKNFILNVTEVHEETVITKQYKCKNRFIPDKEPLTFPFKSVLLDEPGMSVSTAVLDHSIPCLGFAIKEKFHVNIIKEKLFEFGLETGPWLREFKETLYADINSNREFKVPMGGDDKKVKKFPLKDLAKKIALITPGQKITYITDVIYSRFNINKIVELAKGSDHLFIEAAFLDQDKSPASEKYHLTAKQAGIIAGMARVKRFTIFHFSPRYTGMEHLLHEEAERAFNEFCMKNKESKFIPGF